MTEVDQNGCYPYGGRRRSNFSIVFLIILLLLCFPFFCGGYGCGC